VSSRGALLVVAAEPKKGLDSGEQRDKLSKAARLINRTYRSAVNTRIKKVGLLGRFSSPSHVAQVDYSSQANDASCLQVIKLAEEYKAKIEVIGTEDDVKPLEQLISEAYTEIDKAVKRNLLHKNNGARKKARIARYKRDVLVQAGLYTPEAGQPGFKAPKAAPLRLSA
jgi:small subunit ribosomal protein S20